jgi:hypothetical protein
MTRVRIEPAPAEAKAPSKRRAVSFLLGSEARWALAGLAASGGLILLGLNEFAIPGLVVVLALYVLREHLL